MFQVTIYLSIFDTLRLYSFISWFSNLNYLQWSKSNWFIHPIDGSIIQYRQTTMYICIAHTLFRRMRLPRSEVKMNTNLVIWQVLLTKLERIWLVNLPERMIMKVSTGWFSLTIKYSTRRRSRRKRPRIYIVKYHLARLVWNTIRHWHGQNLTFIYILESLTRIQTYYLLIYSWRLDQWNWQQSEGICCCILWKRWVRSWRSFCRNRQKVQSEGVRIHWQRCKCIYLYCVLCIL